MSFKEQFLEKKMLFTASFQKKYLIAASTSYFLNSGINIAMQIFVPKIFFSLNALTIESFPEKIKSRTYASLEN